MPYDNLETALYGHQGKQGSGGVSDNRLIYLERDTGLEPATFVSARRGAFPHRGIKRGRQPFGVKSGMVGKRRTMRWPGAQGLLLADKL